MSKERGDPRGCESVPLRLLVRVREVDDHPQPVHLRHDCASLVRESPGGPSSRRTGQSVGFCLPLRGTGRRGRPVEVVVVRERHVPSAQLEHLSQDRQGVRDRLPALQADEAGDASRAQCGIDVDGSVRGLQVIRIARRQSVDRVDLLECGDDGVLLRDGRRHPRGPELRAHAAAAQPHQVRVELVPLRIQALDAVAGPVPQRERQVVVAVQDRDRSSRIRHAPSLGLWLRG